MAPTIAKPGGMPGGMLTLSANGGKDGIVWGTFSISGDANRTVVAGGLAAFDATTLALLWRSDQSSNGGVSNAVGTMSKFTPPLVINGKVFVPTYSNKVVVYGATGTGVGTPATTFASMYLRGTFNGWEKQAAMGRLATNTWTQTVTINGTTDCFKFDALGDWTINFGGVNRASGTAIQGGANICPNVQPGAYAITFNDATKSFSVSHLVAIGQAPMADAGGAGTPDAGLPDAATSGAGADAGAGAGADAGADAGVDADALDVGTPVRPAPDAAAPSANQSSTPSGAGPACTSTAAGVSSTRGYPWLLGTMAASLLLRRKSRHRSSQV